MKNKLKVNELNDADLKSQIDETYKELRENRFHYSVVKTIENTKVFRKLRKQLAVLLTEQTKRTKK